MSKEIRIGILALIAIAIFVFGYNFLKSKSLLSGNNVYYIEYKNVNQLGTAAPVLVNGLSVGTVKDVYLKENDYTTIVVEIEVKSEIRVPKNTVAQIIATGIMGGKAVKLVMDGICEGDDCAQHGDYLVGDLKGFLDSMVGTDKVEEYTDALQVGLSKVLDSLTNQLNQSEDKSQSIDDLQSTIHNLSGITAKLNRLLAASNNNLIASFDNLNDITGNLKNNNAQITAMLENTANFSKQLNDIDLPATTKELEASLSSLKSTLVSADETLKGLQPVLTNLNSEDNTFGKLLNDPTLYDNLNRTSRQIELLMEDVRLNPKRYTRILSRKQIPYETPSE